MLPLKLFGSPEQKKRFMPRLARGELSAFALTEEGAARLGNVGCRPRSSWRGCLGSIRGWLDDRGVEVRYTRFHDGEPVVAEDVRYAIERACDPDTGSDVGGDAGGPAPGSTDTPRPRKQQPCPT